MNKTILLLFCLTWISCTKEGLDGKFIISGTAMHHSEIIANTKVWVAFGASEFPGKVRENYDLEIQADLNGRFSVENLKKGNYYFYGMGYDSLIQDSVFGGMRIAVNKNNAEVDFTLAVTED